MIAALRAAGAQCSQQDASPALSHEAYGYIEACRKEGFRFVLSESLRTRGIAAASSAGNAAGSSFGRFRSDSSRPLGARSGGDFFVTMSGEGAPQSDLAGDPMDHTACAMGLNTTVSVYILLI